MIKKCHLLMVLILILQIANALYWGSRKEGYYIDELWSYGLSNSYYEPFLQDREGYMGQWHEPEFYLGYLVVDKDNSFSYDSVYYNQANDVHPPLYYMLLHTVCSLWPGVFSKWFGLGVNLLLFAGVIWLLYEISGQILGRTNLARLVPPLIYGFSGGALSAVMYIRMYMLLTFWALLFTFLTFRAMKDDKGRLPLGLGIFLTVTAGFLTQYYFLIFAFFVSAGYVLWQIFHKRFLKAAGYSAAVLGGIGMGILLFPPSLSHIFQGEQGRDSFANMSQGFAAFYWRLREYDKLIAREFWGTRFGTDILVACILAFGILLLIGRKGRQGEKKRNAAAGAMWWILAMAAAGYFALVSQISTDIVDRYQFAIYPAGVLAAVVVIYRMLECLGKAGWVWALAGVYLALCVFCYAGGNINYIQKGYAEAQRELGTEYKDVPGIYVTPGDHLVINDCILLAQQDRTLPIEEDRLEELPQICNVYPDSRMILYVNVYYNGEQTADRMAQIMDYRSVHLLYDNTFTKIYVLSK